MPSSVLKSVYKSLTDRSRAIYLIGSLPLERGFVSEKSPHTVRYIGKTNGASQDSIYEHTQAHTHQLYGNLI